MAEKLTKAALARKTEAEVLWTRGDAQQDAGNYGPGLKLLLSAARMGSWGAMSKLGYTYDVGLGVRKDRATAMYWYKRACRYECQISANNIGTMYRDEKKWRWAIYWFQRALEFGHGYYLDPAMQIAKIYLKQDDIQSAIPWLKRVTAATPPNEIDEDWWREAKLLLRRYDRRKKNVRRK
jgi:TPR repeat protein